MTRNTSGTTSQADSPQRVHVQEDDHGRQFHDDPAGPVGDGRPPTGGRVVPAERGGLVKQIQESRDRDREDRPDQDAVDIQFSHSRSLFRLCLHFRRRIPDFQSLSLQACGFRGRLPARATLFMLSSQMPSENGIWRGINGSFRLVPVMLLGKQEECEEIKPDSYPAHIGTWFEDEEGTVTYECLSKPLVGTTDLFLGVIRGTMVLY